MANVEKIGSKNRDLVLETKGKVYIKVYDVQYPLNFRDQTSGNDVSDQINELTKKISELEERIASLEQNNTENQ